MSDRFYRLYGKRLFDFCAGAAGLVLFSPLFLIIGVLIKLFDEGPVFYRQTRIGKNFVPFSLLKFRTMTVGADRKGPLITTADDPRITPVGRLLRKTKLDELPQLINVLKGDMSMVGPRPEVAKYVEMFRDEHYNDILTIRPGITDYAAVEFRDEEELLNSMKSPEEGYVRDVLPKKIELYRQYLDRMSFSTDVGLILRTLGRILGR